MADTDYLDIPWFLRRNPEEARKEQMNDEVKCQLCGEPMPEGEEMFNYHGYSGSCPKQPKLQQYQLRVVIEKKDLDEKIDKLTAFIDSQTFTDLAESEQERLVRQLHYMGHYTAVLGERIDAFGST